MRSHSFRVTLARCSLALVLCVATATAQCLDWSPNLKTLPGATNQSVLATCVFDDGTGPALYVGGTFTIAGSSAAARIARWDGTQFTPLGSGTNAQVLAMAAFDDGTGPALYVGGSFTNAGGINVSYIAKWNGTSWSQLPQEFNSWVYSLTVFDDGSGPALYAAGLFTTSNLVPVNHVAKWNGSSWLPLAQGVSGIVYSLAVFDDGSGSALYAGGSFSTASGVATGCVAKWNGAQWSALRQGIPPGIVYTLAAFDDGSGPALYAAGNFSIAGGQTANNIARWNGTSWSPLGVGTTLPVFSMLGFDDGSGPALYVGGGFTSAGGVFASRIARWRSSGWSTVGAGLGDLLDSTNAVHALCTFDDGRGPVLCAAGFFAGSGSAAAPNLAQWNGAAWSGLGVKPDVQGADGFVRALTTSDDGAGTQLYVGGAFTHVGSTWSEGVARWNGSSWTQLILYMGGEVRALLGFDDGTGWKLYAGGEFYNVDHVGYENIARWNGTSWSTVGSGFNQPVDALAVYDSGSGPMLYAAGEFNVSGATSLNAIARWNGSSWVALGSGMNGAVNALTVFDDGGGSKLYVGGTFTSASGTSAGYIARWNGTSWSSLAGGNLNLHVYSECVFDDGSGPALYVGGAFTSAGAASAKRVAKWNGTSWSALGNGFDDGVVFSLFVFDDGSGPALYAGGGFSASGGVPMPGMAKWNGTSWTPLGSGMSFNAGTPIVRTMAAFGNGGAPNLFVGGSFSNAGVNLSSNIAEWRACESPIDTFCFGDGTVAPCPCGNSGITKHGCANSAVSAGARLIATGTPSPDMLVLQSSGELPTALSIFLQGDAILSAPANFGDGLRCASGHLKRLYAKHAFNGAVAVPQPGDLSISAQSAALGDPIAPGSIRYYQTYYRDPSPTFCPPPQGDNWNVTNGVRVVW